MKKAIWPVLINLLLAAVLLGACAAPAAAPAGDPPELVVMTHDSFAVSEELIKAFEEEHGVRVSFLKAGDTGSTLNRAILTKNAPDADVLYGVDNTFLSRALEAELFMPYDSPLLAEIPDAFKLAPNNEALPVNYGDVCINYDKEWFAANQLPLPDSLEDLLDPQYAGLLVVQNPATSSPGLSFLLATIANFGEEGYLDFWAGLRANQVVVVSDWETAYYSNFTRYGGAQPMVVSYSSSPAAEVIFSPEPLDEAPTASILGDLTCFRQVEFVGILAGARQPELAQRFVDFMLSRDFQEDLPLQMFVYPVRPDAQLPAEFSAWAQVAPNPAQLDAGLISANRERWIQEWDEVVLR